MENYTVTIKRNSDGKELFTTLNEFHYEMCKLIFEQHQSTAPLPQPKPLHEWDKHFQGKTREFVQELFKLYGFKKFDTMDNKQYQDIKWKYRISNPFEVWRNLTERGVVKQYRQDRGGKLWVIAIEFLRPV
jgi:hypothetical protein